MIARRRGLRAISSIGQDDHLPSATGCRKNDGLALIEQPRWLPAAAGRMPKKRRPHPLLKRQALFVAVPFLHILCGTALGHPAQRILNALRQTGSLKCRPGQEAGRAARHTFLCARATAFGA
jgi:hypothetical protein